MSRFGSFLRRGVTLVELLVVVAIIGLLVALLLPAVQSAREAARRTMCQNNLRQTGVAMLNHHATHEAFPIGCIENRGRQLAWTIALLPFMEESSLAQGIDKNFAFNSVENSTAGSTILPTFLCPSASTELRGGPTSGDANDNGMWDAGDNLAWTDYGGMFGAGDPALPLANGVLIYDRPISINQITDGTTKTILVGEDTGRSAAFHGEWINGQNVFDQVTGINVSRNNELFSDHPGGAYVLMCDSSVHFLSEDTETQALLARCTRALADNP